jgi:hypothetical protein
MLENDSRSSDPLESIQKGRTYPAFTHKKQTSVLNWSIF